MATDYVEGVCPPQWCWDRVNELIGTEPNLWGPDDWPKRFSLGSACTFASYIWRYEEPPVDPAMDAVREAIAAYADATLFHDEAKSLRAGHYEKSVNAALASLRNAGVLK